MNRLLAVLLSTFVLIALACGGRPPKEENKQQVVEDKRDGKGPDKQGEEATWAHPDQAARLGDLEVRVTKVSVGKAEIKDAITGQEGLSQNRMLIIKLDLRNASATKKISYNTWAGKTVSARRDHGTLKDNHGNAYNRMKFNLGTIPLGAVDRFTSIYPEKSVTEVLVFEAPVENAAHLDLELPGSNFGETGFVRFRIPAGLVAKQMD